MPQCLTVNTVTEISDVIGHLHYIRLEMVVLEPVNNDLPHDIITQNGFA